MAKAGTGVIITGDKFIDKALAEFEPKVQKQITRKATRESARLVLETAKLLAPSGYGTLERSLRVRAMVKRQGSRRGGSIGHSVVTGEGFFAGEAFYGGFLEFGTKERHHKSGKSVGAIQPGAHDYLRPALYQNKAAVRQLFTTSMKAAIGEARIKKTSSQ